MNQRAQVARPNIKSVFIATAMLLITQAIGAASPTDHLIPPDLVASVQTAPANAAKMTSSQLIQILEQKAPTDQLYASLYNTRVDGGPGELAPLQVIQTKDANHPYIGVSHVLNQNVRLFDTWLSSSKDLITWIPIGLIHTAASMPTLRVLPDDSLLLAEERNIGGQRPLIEVTYFGNTPNGTGLMNFVKNPQTTEGVARFTKVLTPGASSDGTPEITAVSYAGNIFTSRIIISRHFMVPGGMDTEGLGVLTNFSAYQNLGADTQANAALVKAGATAQHGGRSFFYIGSQLYEIVEGNTADQNFGTWSLFLLRRDSNLAVTGYAKLNIDADGGGRSLANPHLSFVTLPNGHPALILTMFIFSENNFQTPAGGHSYIYDLANF